MTGACSDSSAGSTGGSVEIVLSAALRAARGEGASGTGPPHDLDIPAAAEHADLWLWERLVECDGLIVATPIISRTMAAGLKVLVDRLLGPNADAAIIEHLVALRRHGTSRWCRSGSTRGCSGRAWPGSWRSAAR